jgi:hypothetical protein
MTRLSSTTSSKHLSIWQRVTTNPSIRCVSNTLPNKLPSEISLLTNNPRRNSDSAKYVPISRLTSSSTDVYEAKTLVSCLHYNTIAMEALIGIREERKSYPVQRKGRISEVCLQK